MNRCLHVTIHENSTAARRRATPYRPGWTGTDPGSDYVMPPPEDPGSDYVMPPPEDPGSDYVMPPPEDPNATGYTGEAGHSAACAESVSVHSCCGCCCGCGAPAAAPAQSTGTATPHPFIAPREFSGFVIVRMAPWVDPNAASLWELAGPEGSPRFPGLKAVLELPLKTKEGKEAQRPASGPADRPVTDPGAGVPSEKVQSRISNPPSIPVTPTSAPLQPKDTLVSRPLVEFSKFGREKEKEIWVTWLRGECLSKIREMEKKTALTAFSPVHSLTAYWRLDAREYSDLVEEIVAQLNRLAEVDLAYRELAAKDPQTVPGGKAFAEDQGYLNDAPVGISASWAWQSLAGMASSITICDLEQGWDIPHNDLPGISNQPPLGGANRALEDNSFGNHGTAVGGQLMAAGSNVKGIAAGFGKLALASHYLSKNAHESNGQSHPFAGTNGHVAAAIAQAVSTASNPPLKAGDVLLLEVQRGLLPTEIDEADLDAIRLASGLGIIVIEAAGNGGFDLDAWSDSDTHQSLRRSDPHFRDSGAVFVGAARASLPHDRAPFSNYGSRLDCFGWGETVTTCGYGDLSGTAPLNYYTNSFNGTSSASPMVAGAAALLQALHWNSAGYNLEPRAMRALLSDPTTGTRQGPNVPGFIGVMPDLRAIIRGRLQLVPVVYMRRSVCDDGSKPEPDDEISSSPDIFFWQGTLGDRYDEGKGRENLPAPGKAFTAPASNTTTGSNSMNRSNTATGSNLSIYVRLRNRGLGAGDAHVHLFASPAATLITPERWVPWGSLDATNLPQGDTLTVVPGPASLFNLTSPPSAPNTPWSFLAVLSRPGENGQVANSNFVDWMAALPPGSLYFDWAQYRSFLRRRGVAWRNTHRVEATATNPNPVLPFFIAGTPERAHSFDFEVIQRLPAKATVDLQVPPALDAKFRQRLPWIGTAPGPLRLPKRPRTVIKGIALAAGTYADTSFTVTPDSNNPLGPSHSLAIRQLWRGEEVGRITWYFGLDT